MTCRTYFKSQSRRNLETEVKNIDGKVYEYIATYVDDICIIAKVIKEIAVERILKLHMCSRFSWTTPTRSSTNVTCNIAQITYNDLQDMHKILCSNSWL